MSSNWRRYQVVLPDGEVVHRRTMRQYTHVVVARDIARRKWGVWSWVGRPDLVATQTRLASRLYGADSVRVIDAVLVGGPPHA